MTDEERALIEAIRAEPEEDDRRLVYADWLDDHGQPDRAELIRVQLARQTNAQNTKLIGREQDLLARDAARWLGQLADAGLLIRRGMAVACWKSLADFERGTARLARAGDPPWVVERWFQVDARSLEPAQLEDLVRSPGYGQLTRLRLVGATPALARAVADSPLSANLLGLWLDNADLGASGARALATSTHLGRLRRLHLSHARLTPAGLSALAGSTSLSSLTDLGLMGAAEGDEATETLATAAGLPRLESLTLTMNKIGDARLRRLLQAPWLGQLKELVLASNSVRDGGAKALAGCADLSGLRVLNLNINQVGDAGALALLGSPHLRGLRELSLGFNRKLTEPLRRKITRRFGGVGETSRGYYDLDWGG